MRTFILIFLFSPGLFAQGPVDGFFKQRGDLDLALSGFYQKSEKFYHASGLITYPRELAGASIYAHYAILENFSAIVNVPFINGNFQDAGIYFKYGAFKNWLNNGVPFRVIPACGISFPISNYATQTGQSIGQRAVQIQPKLVLQLNLKGGFFVQAQGGYNYTLDPVPSSIPFSAKIGTNFSALKKMYRTKTPQPEFYADLWFDYQKGLGDVIWAGGASQDFRTLHVTYSKIGGVIYYGMKPTRCNRNTSRSMSRLGFFINGSYILNGVNLGKAFSIGAGVVFKFDLLREMYEKPGFKPPYDPDRAP